MTGFSTPCNGQDLPPGAAVDALPGDPAVRAAILVKSANRLLGIRGVADRPDAGRSRQRMKDSFI
jgi:hypothetical protein